ncbi:MAG: ABC transporter permease [Pirellulales bacterium]
MYKLLLCWRYLRTRYIALASIISVTLGVATMIVVNSVMAGFAYEMQTRIHGILSDMVFESHSLDGFLDPEWHMEQIQRIAGDRIEGMTPTVTVPAILSFQVRGNLITRPVQLIGIDAKTQSRASDFGKYLKHPANRQTMSFHLRENGFDARDPLASSDQPERRELAESGWQWRRRRVERERAVQLEMPKTQPSAAAPAVKDPFAPPLPPAFGAAQAAPQGARAAAPADSPQNPFPAPAAEERVFDPAHEQHTGLVLGIALASVRTHDGQERFLVRPGDDVTLTFPTAGVPPRAMYDTFTVVDLYESKMSEYDSTFVFVPIEKLQELRHMYDDATGVFRATSIQIKLKDGVDGNQVRDELRAAFTPELYGIYTWRDKQGPLLAAVDMETAILNILLFLIIAVAGFGILAIFYMIVVEKTRDIGILKSLGASGRGVMGIFLGYGLSLGLVGSGVGMILGLWFVSQINEIAKWLGKLSGRDLFDPSIYYFYKIPTIVQPWTITWIVAGALAIAVLASVLPARHAARLHPVEALRYE